jgi:hypothetical protein
MARNGMFPEVCGINASVDDALIQAISAAGSPEKPPGRIGIFASSIRPL